MGAVFRAARRRRADGALLARPGAGVQIEKRLLALVPGSARVCGTMKDALNGQIRLEGLPGWTASVGDASCAVDPTDASVLSIAIHRTSGLSAADESRPPAGQPFDVVVPLVGRDAVIALANGTILAPGAQVDIGALRGAVAVSPPGQLSFIWRERFQVG